jgi:tetratricopeptide (TPR) repeat protein
MPATLLEIAQGVRRVLGDGRPLTEDDLVDALVERGLELGASPGETVAEVLEGDDVGLVLPLGDGRHALLPALLAGRTLTHRVSAAEVEHGFLNVSPDLEPVSILTDDDAYRRLVDGTALVEAFPGLDDDLLTERDIPLEVVGEDAWVLEPGVLRGLDLSVGDLVGVTVRPDGFEVGPVSLTDPAPDLGARLTDALQRLGDGGPDQIDSIVWLACADDPDLFTSPLPPLAEVFAAAGLVTDGEQVGPAGFDFASWRVSKRLESIADIHQLDEDSALAVLALARLYDQVASVVEHAQHAVDAGETLAAPLIDTPAEPDAAAEAAGPAGTDRRLVRDTLEFLADPAVAAAVHVETIGAGREGAAALGVFAETLEQQAPRSARPALRWLRGKAHERLGDIAQAEEAFESALGMDASSPLALFELARYASDRGDAERGLSLLRRAGAPVDDELVVLLEHFRPAERRDIGRNEPCWCGSGRKYKVCHRTRETLPLAERAAWLYQKAGAYLAEGPWRADVLEVAQIRAAHSDHPAATYLATQDPLVCDAVLFEGGAFAAFLDDRGALLPDDERLLAQQWLLAERSVHEIETVSTEHGFTARDLRTGDRVDVRERTASRSLKPGMLICARLVPAGDTTQCFGGLEPVALHERDELLALLDGEPGPDQLVWFLSRRFAPPVLQNTEGDPLVFCEATLRSDDPDALAAALDTRYDRDESEQRWFEHVTTHGMQRIRATITLDGPNVRVETNSEPRMDRVLDALRTLQPGVQLLTQTRRPAEDLHEATSRAPDGAPVQTLDPNDPQIRAALEQMTRAHEQAWLDEPIPALAGATPRQAAADPTRRPDLIRLLDTLGPAGPGAMDADRLRTQLGL